MSTLCQQHQLNMASNCM